MDYHWSTMYSIPASSVPVCIHITLNFVTLWVFVSKLCCDVLCHMCVCLSVSLTPSVCVYLSLFPLCVYVLCVWRQKCQERRKRMNVSQYVSLKINTFFFSFQILVLDEIWISTDSKEVTNTIQKYFPSDRIQIHYRTEHCDDRSSSISSIHEFLQHHPGNIYAW